MDSDDESDYGGYLERALATAKKKGVIDEKPKAATKTNTVEKEVTPLHKRLMEPVNLTKINFHKLLRKTPPKGFGSVYLIRPLKSTKGSTGYTGRTVMSVNRRLRAHTANFKSKKKYTLQKVIQKRGAANFTVELLETNIPQDDLPAAEKKYVALYDTFHRGYNETEGGETAPLLNEQIKANHKAALQRPEVKAKMSSAGKKRMSDPEVRAKFYEGLEAAYKRPEVIARKSAACKKLRQDPELEIQRGLAKRATTLRKRAEQRSKLKTEKERRAFDLRIMKSDRHLAKTGKSMTQKRLLDASSSDSTE